MPLIELKSGLSLFNDSYARMAQDKIVEMFSGVGKKQVSVYKRKDGIRGLSHRDRIQ
jgi:hypothetical protein